MNLNAVIQYLLETKRRYAQTSIIYDQRALMEKGERGKQKWYPNRRRKKKKVCVHHTGNKTGAGARRKAIRKYKKLHKDRPYQVHKGQFKTLERLPKLVTPDEYFHILATFDRYRGVPLDKWNQGFPYHALTSPSSDLVYNLEFGIWTWASDDANEDSVAYAVDADLRYEKDRAMFSPADLQWDLRAVISTAREEGHPIEEVEFHCQYTNKPFDPGWWYIKNVAIPVVASDANLHMRMDWKQKDNFRTPNEVLKAA